MTRIGCRAHDYGKLPAAELAATLRAKGYNAAQLAMPRAIAGIEDFSHITDKQLAEIRTAFAAQDVEISVLKIPTASHKGLLYPSYSPVSNPLRYYFHSPQK